MAGLPGARDPFCRTRCGPWGMPKGEGTPGLVKAAGAKTKGPGFSVIY